MLKKTIIEEADRLIEKCGTSDPFEIASMTGIKLKMIDYFEEVKGAYFVIEKNRYVFLNSNLPDELQRVVLAHELGHDRLHSDAAEGGLIDNRIYDISSNMEYEANLFAAELLIDDDEILSYIFDGGLDIEGIANSINAPVDLAGFKIDILKEKGYKFNNVDYKSNFLKSGRIDAKKDR